MRAKPWAVSTMVAALGALGACKSLTDPALPGNAAVFDAPAIYTQWWSAVEQCSGLTGSLSAVTFYVVPGNSVNDGRDGDVSGYWSKASNRIVLAGAYTNNGPLVRHEMLHALIQGVGHPALYFQQKCAGVVVCVKTCLTAASQIVADASADRALPSPSDRPRPGATASRA